MLPRMSIFALRAAIGPKLRTRALRKASALFQDLAFKVALREARDNPLSGRNSGCVAQHFVPRVQRDAVAACQDRVVPEAFEARAGDVQAPEEFIEMPRGRRREASGKMQQMLPRVAQA